MSVITHKIYEDDTNSIIISSEGYSNLIVQLIVYVKYMTDAKSLTQSTRTLVVESHTIPTRHGDKTNSNFKNEVSQAIKKCQEKLVKIQQDKELIEGTLRDYVKL